MVKQCEAARPSTAPNAEAKFVRADLSLVSEQKQAVKDITAAAPNGIDIMIQTQGGPPNGKWEVTSEGHEVCAGFST